MTGVMLDETEEASSGALVVKPTGWATNSENIVAKLDMSCTNAVPPPGWKQCRHKPLSGARGLAKKCEVYPIQLVRAVVEGLKEELETGGRHHAGEIGFIDAE